MRSKKKLLKEIDYLLDEQILIEDIQLVLMNSKEKLEANEIKADEAIDRIYSTFYRIYYDQSNVFKTLVTEREQAWIQDQEDRIQRNTNICYVIATIAVIAIGVLIIF